MRSDLMIVIRDIIDERTLKPKKAAYKLGLTQSQVNYIQIGEIEKISIDILMKSLFRLGFRFRSFYQNKQLSIDVWSFKSH